MSSQNTEGGRINSKYNKLYRAIVEISINISFALKYIHTHRANLLDASRVNKIHHLKEIGIRFGIGCLLGYTTGLMLFGPR